MTTALTTIDAREVAPHIAEAPAIIQPQKEATPQSLRIAEVGEALLPAYQKASTLDLSDDEIAKLTAPFPDSSVEVRPHDGLIYIPHIFISKRMNQVFRPGQWSLIRRWERMEGNRIYSEWVMVIRGCYIGESVGAQDYQPNNPKQNYADVLEATRGEAIRRIAAKQLSCGDQCWEPSYARDWVAKNAEQFQGKWRRKGTASASQAPATNYTQPPQHAAPTVKPAAKTADIAPPAQEATEATRNWMIASIETMHLENELQAYGIDKAIIMPNESLSDWPLRHVPTSKQALTALVKQVESHGLAGQGLAPVENEEWRQFPMPYGKNAGTPLEDLEKPYLFGLWANMAVETEYNGKPKKPETIAKDTKFREMLDAAGIHYNFEKNWL